MLVYHIHKPVMYQWINQGGDYRVNQCRDQRDTEGGINSLTRPSPPGKVPRVAAPRGETLGGSSAAWMRSTGAVRRGGGTGREEGESDSEGWKEGVRGQGEATCIYLRGVFGEVSGTHVLLCQRCPSVVWGRWRRSWGSVWPPPSAPGRRTYGSESQRARGMPGTHPRRWSGKERFGKVNSVGAENINKYHWSQKERFGRINSVGEGNESILLIWEGKIWES